MKDYEKMTLQELWTEYQRLGMEATEYSIKLSTISIQQHSLVSWIFGRYEESISEDLEI